MAPQHEKQSRVAARGPRRVGALAAILLGGMGLPTPMSARAVPSFARQTGLQCTSCHTAFPQLTPFGRYFKVHGYVQSSGESHLPPLAMMVQAPTFTRTNQGQPGGAAEDFDENNNVALNQLSFFYAGRLLGPYAQDLFGERAGNVLDHFGAFIQGTYDGVGKEWAWDNTEMRGANTGHIAGKGLVYGGYVNNNPTLQDLWNTTPAWGFPFSSSGLAPESVAAPLISGELAQQVAGFGGYGLVAETVYADVGAYGTLSADMQDALGVDPTDETQLDGLAPYWRIALQHTWKAHSFELGTYGLDADTFPARMSQAGNDHITDLGVDSQYQYSTERNDITVLVNYIRQHADWNASQALGLASNAGDDLWTLTATASYLFDKTYGADVQYFVTDGSSDELLYGTRTGSPKTSGWVFQLDWLPLARHGGPWFWSKSNVKLSVQYVLYQQFDGSSSNYDGEGRDASDNDTLYLQAWIAF